MIPTRIRRMIDDCANYADIKKQFHPEPNVKNHLGQVTTLAIEAGAPWEVCYAALLHDIGKNKNDAKAWAQHAYRGALMIAADVPPEVRWLVENHMKAYDYKDGTMRAHKRKILEEHELFDWLMMLCDFDHNGRNADGVHMSWDDIYDFFDHHDPRINEVIVMVGIQAAGKSTVSNGIVDASRDHGEWWKPKWERTCRDDIRLIVGAGPGAWRHQENCVIEIQRKAIRMALGRGQGIVIDNTHNTIRRRRDAMEWLRDEFPGIHIKAHVVYAPLEVCIERNKAEHGKPHRHRLLIPDKVLAQFHGDLISGLGHITDVKRVTQKLLDEGFDDAEITYTH